MKKYILGLLKYLFYKRVSLLAQVTFDSNISRKSKVNRFSKVYSSNILDYSYIGPNTELVLVNIGKFCSIAQNCSIGLATHTIENISTSPIFTEKHNGTSFSWIEKDTLNYKPKIVEIGNDVWIGKNATILSNIKVGNGAIIGTGAIVTKDVPDYAVVAGVPANIIKYRFSKEIINKLLEIRWWDLPEISLKKNIHIFQKEKITLEDLNRIILK
ncbi:CatB-related O-acetyltransferase [Bacteroidales bacterium MB20-C3-3]|nr:CatB-related O-acetyltransferase [Bacteroidales bacterium MB20-C3-3]